MSQVHKRFTSDQVKELLDRFINLLLRPRSRQRHECEGAIALVTEVVAGVHIKAKVLGCDAKVHYRCADTH